MGNYLIGRNEVTRGFYEDGARALDAALAVKLPTNRIARETLRQRAIAACALSQPAVLMALRARIRAENSPFDASSGGRRDATLRMIDRCIAANL